MRGAARTLILPVFLLTACGRSAESDRAVPGDAAEPAAAVAAEPSTPPDIGTFMVTTPTAGQALDSVVVLRAHLVGPPATRYAMCWQVDGGQLNPMEPDEADRIAYVDVRAWNWSEAGPYFITLVAQDAEGTTIGRRSIPVFVDRPGSRDATPVVQLSHDRCTAPLR